ncbi:aa3-type cytochrome oxidase subunit CtaJ [Couchioplanes caeruleus]|uniref:aa3-type cytochrome oxidase subunit CtaJ n=1 Tax=Couchioplanes caeruleus TaxID=56438 RepID=UPI003D3235C1
MSIFSTILIFAGIPLAAIVVISALAAAGGRRTRRDRRYRPGRPYDFQPIWFLASPSQVSPAYGGRTSGGVAQPPALESGAVEVQSGRPVPAGVVGGASDRW